MHISKNLKKTIYITKETFAKVQREVGLEIYEGKKSSISKKLSDIVEGYYSTKKSTSKSLKVTSTTRPSVDISVLGAEFTSQALKELYISHGLNKRSAETKIARLKKDGKIEIAGKGKYKLL